MRNIILYSLLASFTLSFVFITILLKNLKENKVYQYIREDGPKRHLNKFGTPSFGGVGFVLAITMSVIISIFIFDIPFMMMFFLLYPLLAFALIGFVDDYLNYHHKKNQGLSGNYRLILESIVTIAYFYIYLRFGYPTTINLFGFYNLNIIWIYGVFILFLMVGTSNAVNLTDGLDGLAGTVSVIAFVAFLIIGIYKSNHYVILFSASFIGALLAFLVFNHNPAKIFMGDTGSLAIGASLATISILLKMELLLLFIGFVYIIETLSDIIQVLYFKATKGKRIFLMAPLHHHFELKGYSENKIVLLFSMIETITALIAVLLGVNLF